MTAGAQDKVLMKNIQVATAARDAAEDNLRVAQDQLLMQNIKDAIAALDDAEDKIKKHLMDDRTSDKQRQTLTDDLQSITSRKTELRKCKVTAIANSAEVQKALASLGRIALKMKKTAAEMVTATKALNRVNAILGLAAEVIGFFGT